MGEHTRIRTVVVATDGSAHGSAALAFVSALPWPPETKFWVTSVVEAPLPEPPPTSRHLAKGEADWRRLLEQAHVDARELAWGHVVDAATVLRQHHPAVRVEEVARLGEPAVSTSSRAIPPFRWRTTRKACARGECPSSRWTPPKSCTVGRNSV